MQRDLVIEPIINLVVEHPTTLGATHAKVSPTVATPEKTTLAVKKNFAPNPKKAQTVILEKEV